MNSLERLSILSAAARYDASCASSGSRRSGNRGACLPAGVCHSWTGDGRCVSLLKILYSNACLYDCSYCVNRVSNDTPRTSFKPREIADLTMDFWIRNYVEGLFLSSGVYAHPDTVMEKLVQTAKILRRDRGFKGYIHLKVIPGTSEFLINEAGLYADRLSVNVEVPTGKSLALLAPQKNGQSIFGAMKRIDSGIESGKDASKKYAHAPAFASAGQSTQLIVGVSPEKDADILRLSSALYSKMRLKRVYYSAYINSGSPIKDAASTPPLVREHRLYQADWLLRFYRYGWDEIVTEENPDLDLTLDPKCAWALRHPEYFPVDLATADRERILRVPGIGVTGTEKILSARRSGSFSFASLPRLGIAMKRARYFIAIKGRHPEHVTDCRALRAILTDGTSHSGETVPGTDGKKWTQKEFDFDFDAAV